MTITSLNNTHAIPGQLEFIKGKGDLPLVSIDNGKARALISVYAGQVLSFHPAGQAQDLLFVSDAAYYQQGKAIKGGIPVCWPWFGPDPEDRGRAAHGFVRNRPWTVRSTETLANGDTRITLGLVDSTETRGIWPAAFDLSLQVTVGNGLRVELLTRNTGDQPFTITQALHSYFNVGAIGQVQVLGLEGTDYLDKAGDGSRNTQAGAIRFDKEVDRIYLDVQPGLVIDDAGLGRRISITSTGSHTAVVWNPWAELSVKMGDLRDDDYQRFVCVETANAATDVVEVKPGGEFRLGADYRIDCA
ncbi:MAG: D-hexose-6-phosphate mutarotase [Gammaproteobacteria bacterium]|nr:MAG: D-hexose-6-phosphate mutarotase [Gammaproteobacteria bacterium]